MLTLLIYFNRNLIGFGCNQYVRYYYVTRVDGDRKSMEAWITVNFEINRDIDIEALSACVHQHLLSLCCTPNRPAAETTRRFHTVGVAAPCLYRDHCIEFHSLSVCSRVYGAVQHSFTHSVEDQRQIADNPLIIGLICRHSITSPLHVFSTDKCDVHLAGAALCCVRRGGLLRTLQTQWRCHKSVNVPLADRVINGCRSVAAHRLPVSHDSSNRRLHCSALLCYLAACLNSVTVTVSTLTTGSILSNFLDSTTLPSPLVPSHPLHSLALRSRPP